MRNNSNVVSSFAVPSPCSWHESQILRITTENGTDPGLVEDSDFRIEEIQPADHCLVELVKFRVAVKRTTTLVFPRSGDCREAVHGMHRRRTVS